MSNFSDFKDGAEQLDIMMEAAHVSPADRNIQIGLFYQGAIASSMAKMADDIHKISKTLDEINRRRV